MTSQTATVEPVTVEELTDEGLIRALHLLVDGVEARPDSDRLFDLLIKFECEADRRNLLG